MSRLRPNLFRHILSTSFDTIMAGATFMLALYLRWGDEMWHSASAYLWQGVLLSMGLMLILVLYTRLYRRFWRYVSLKDVTTMLKICAVLISVHYAAMFLMMRLEMLPRSIPVLHGLLLASVMIGPRVLVRLKQERQWSIPATPQIPVLLIGATDEAESFIRESGRNPNFAYRAVGVVATDARMAGGNIHHVRVYGTLAQVDEIIGKLQRKGTPPQRLILADLALGGKEVRQLVDIADQSGLPLARMPRLSDLTRGDKNRFDIRPIDVEDLLGRPQAILDLEGMRRSLEGKRILVTGAGGSIGSELVHQIAGFNPAVMILCEQSEYALYQIDQSVRLAFPSLVVEPILTNVRNRQSLKTVFDKSQPQIVFHAAALKHVPLCETNIAEAVLTNVMGTCLVADQCVQHKVEAMIQVSTDKAVNPTNVMGACKRIGEMYCQALGVSQPHTAFITVRFGNVLGSTGSVVPLFQQQLQRGGPLTITHPQMTRYFMTIREAVQLVLQASAMPRDEMDANAPIYVLDMGEPVRIETLAIQMIRLAGLKPHEDIRIDYTGLRPGEKLYEELFYDAEALRPTRHPSIRLAQSTTMQIKSLRDALADLFTLTRARDEQVILQALKKLVPEYQTPEVRPLDA